MKINPAFNENYTTLVMNCSNEYVPYMDVCLQSVLDNSSKKQNYDVVVLETTISKQNKNDLTEKYCSDNFSIRFYNPSKILGIDVIPDTLPNYSKESFYKIIIPHLFKKYKKVIYADVDIIFQCDIDEIQNIDISDYPIAATRDFALVYVSKNDINLSNYLKKTVCYRNPFDYFAAGLMLYDIEKFTEKDIQNMLELAHKNQFWLQEQDLFNKYFNGRIFEIPYKYCVNTAWIDKFTPDFLENENFIREYTEAKQNPKVLHYSGEMKPWNCFSWDKWSPLWWKYARKTYFYEKFIIQELKTFYTKSQEISIKINQTNKLYGKPLKYYVYKILYKTSFGKRRKKYKNKANEIKKLWKELRGEI